MVNSSENLLLTNEYIRSPIFYMGNKLRLLPKLVPLFPKDVATFYDVFGGSGCVAANAMAERVVYNEINPNIVNLHKMFQENGAEWVDSQITKYIKQYNLNSEGICVQQNNPNTAEARTHYEENYLKFRDAYNHSQRDIAMLYTLTFYSFSNLIRFNSKNEFNMPYGNRCYTQEHKYIINRWCSALAKRPFEILNRDAFDVLADVYNSGNTKDFVYCDCPYFNTMAIYNESRAFGGWSIDDDYRLFKWLEDLDSHNIRWGLSNVFANKGNVNQHLIDWCTEHNWKVRHLDFTYSSLGKGNANSDEVYVSNYVADEPELNQFSLF